MVNKLLKRQLRQQQDLIQTLNNAQGFTLIELLIVVLIASVIVSALLTLVVQLIGTEQRESVRTETQREMQLAMNYITSDLRQAVYIYEGNVHPEDATSEPSYINYFPAALQNADDYRPVLAFWKTKPIEDINTSALPAFNPNPAGGGGCQTLVTGPANNPDVSLFNECNNLWLQRQNYSLVAYFQAINNLNTNAGGKWQGKSRIVRYELDKYVNANLTNLTRKPGYVDPAEIGSDGFVAWPYGPSPDTGATAPINCQAFTCEGSTGAAGNPGGAPDTLVDYVDFVTDATPADELALRDDEPDDCGALQIAGNTIHPDGHSVKRVDGNDVVEYFMTPKKSTTYVKPAFFVCLRNTASEDQPNNPRVGQIQDTVVFLRGNANGRGGTATDSFLPTLETRITIRGVIDRVIN